MPLTIVLQTSAAPAVFGAMAAVAARQLDAPMHHLPVDFGPQAGADAQQWVSACGTLLPSGLAWYERLTGRPALPASTPQQILEHASTQHIIVAWHPTLQRPELLAQLLHGANEQGIAVRQLTARPHPDGLQLVDDANASPLPGAWHRDAYGRLRDASVHIREDAPNLLIALAGTEHDQFETYPATLAALADAADAAGVRLAVRFIAPQTFSPASLANIDGLLLPGGTDMANVPGQINAAHYTLAHGIPTLGLCLGMQTMATALAQTLPGSREANMAEAAPLAPYKSFVPMANYFGLPEYRLGERVLQLQHPPFRDLLGAAASVRCNHRYMLNPALWPSLQHRGLVIDSGDAGGQIADVISLAGHPFYMGMQGHPEQSSTSGHPHPLISAFVASVLMTRNQRQEEGFQHCTAAQ
jgi:CTP synthase